MNPAALSLLLAIALLPMVAAHPPATVPAVPAVADLPEAQPAPFCIVVIEPLDDFRQVRITVDEELTEPSKDAAWRQADLNGDGIVSSQEGVAFRHATLAFWPGGEGLGNRSLALRLAAPYTDATPIKPVYAATWRHLGHGFYEEAASSHTGAAKSDPVAFGGFETQAVREYGFHMPNDISTITLRGADPTFAANLSMDSAVQVSKPVIEYVVVRAPPGWIVRSVTGVGYNGTFHITGDGSTLEIPGFDTSSPWEVTFRNPELEERLAYIGSPGMELPAVFAGSAIALAALRFRRRT